MSLSFRGGPALACLVLLASALAVPSFAATAQCGSRANGATCPSGQCCSADGFCGSTGQFCSKSSGCQSGCWSCGNNKCEGANEALGESCGKCPTDCGPCMPNDGIVYECVDKSSYAITFDDGPSPATPKMLDYLKALNVPATFFVVGLMAQWRSATLIREFNEGHVISSHSFSHPDLTKMSDQAMMAEVSNNEELLASLTCYRPKIFRPPFGALLDPQIKILHEMGYTIANWNLDTEDWRVGNDPPTFLQLLNNNLKSLKNSSIIHLQHDLQVFQADIVPTAVQLIRTNYSSYKLVGMEECLFGPNFKKHPSYVFSRRACPESVVPSSEASSCSLSEWSTWSSCTVACGDGEQTRSRFPIYPKQQAALCAGVPLVQSRACFLSPCAGDCTLGNWTEFSACSAPCGGGLMYRTRDVKKPAAPGGTCGFTIENLPCNTQACDGSCLTSEWSPWSTCSAPCGGGTYNRRRSIVSLGTSNCSVPLVETATCNTDRCSSLCTYSGWSEWSTCSQGCGGGFATRNRTVVFPAPDGSSCNELIDTKVCNTKACPQDCVLSSWSSWGACSSTCGGGVSNRTRSVVIPAVAPGVCDLRGNDTVQYAVCNTNACTGTCSYSDFGPWTSCSRTCGYGYSSRVRSRLSATDCGTPTEVVACNTNACPRNCTLSEWTDWTPCYSCSVGNTTRSRTVLLPAVGSGGCDSLTESFQCSLNTCPRNCTVSEWSAWTTCSGPCARGQRTRSRTVLSVADPGASCDIPLWDVQHCLQPTVPSSTPLFGVISPAELGVVEGSTPSAYSVSLTVPLNGTARMTFCSQGITNGAFTVTPSFVDFTPSNWNSPVVVYVQAASTPNDLSEVFYPITHSLAVTSGPAFSVTPFVQDVRVTVIDSQTSNVLTSTQTFRIEEGQTTSYTATLTSRPVDFVQVVVISTCYRTVVTPNVLNFTSMNWNIPRTLSVSVSDDSIDNGGATQVCTISHRAYSPQASYNGSLSGFVTGTIVNNDFAGVTGVGPNFASKTFRVVENATSTIGFQLTSFPLQVVTVSVAVVGVLTATVSPSYFTILAENWNSVTPVRIRTPLIASDTPIRLNLTISSLDPVYNGLGIVSIPVTVYKNRGPTSAPGVNGIMVTPPIYPGAFSTATPFVLDGSRSFDPDGNGLLYMWSYVASYTSGALSGSGAVVPDTSRANIGFPAIANQSLVNVTFPGAGVYTFSLSVTDSSGTTVSSPLTVYVPRIQVLPSLQGGKSTCFIGYTCILTYSWTYMPLLVAGTPPSNTAAPYGPIAGSQRLGLFLSGLPVVAAGMTYPGLTMSYSNVNTALGQATVVATWTVPGTLAANSSYQPLVRVLASGYDNRTASNLTIFNLALPASVISISPPYGYIAGGWSTCSATCNSGTQTRTVTCYNLITNAPVASSFCANNAQVAATLPTSSQPCFVRPCGTYGWSLGQWSACNATCGGGMQSRSVQCISSSGSVVSSGFCPSPAPEATSTCALVDCDRYAWAASGWGACMDPRTDFIPDVGVCGTGFQQRSVRCRNVRTRQEVDASKCEGQAEIFDSRSCWLQGDLGQDTAWPCTMTRVLWLGPWQPCSSTCGGGNRTQDVYCMNTLSGRPVTNNECENYPGFYATIPSGIGSCNVQACPVKTFAWATTAWSACTPLKAVPKDTQYVCGSSKSRSVYCVDYQGNTVPDFRCSGAPRPASTQPCGKCGNCYPLHANGHDADYVCGGHGTCNSDGMTCSCSAGWAGDVCNIPKNCSLAGGVADRNGGCCRTLLNKAGECCLGTNPTLDRNGNCCSSGVLDVCGICNGNGTSIDVTGQCCSGELDARHMCCPKSVGVDVCGVCGGNNVCDIVVSVDISVSSKYTVSDMTDPTGPKWDTISGNIVSYFSRNMGRLNSLVALQSIAQTSPSIYTATVMLKPPGAGTTNAVHTALLPQNDAVTEDMMALTVSLVGGVGTCGNNLCEIGEVCALGSTAECCPQDCIVPASVCPASAAGLPPCSGHGACVAQLSGYSSCECFSEMGYVGDVCNSCAPGYTQAVATDGSLLCKRNFSPSVMKPPPPSPYLFGMIKKAWMIPYGIPVIVGIVVILFCIGLRIRFVRRRKMWLAKMAEKEKLRQEEGGEDRSRYAGSRAGSRTSRFGSKVGSRIGTARQHTSKSVVSERFREEELRLTENQSPASHSGESTPSFFHRPRSARIVPLNTPQNQRQDNSDATSVNKSVHEAHSVRTGARSVRSPRTVQRSSPERDVNPHNDSLSPTPSMDVAVEALFNPTTDFLLNKFGGNLSPEAEGNPTSPLHRTGSARMVGLLTPARTSARHVNLEDDGIRNHSVSRGSDSRDSEALLRPDSLRAWERDTAKGNEARPGAYA